jgi:hypothetical protein
MNNEMSLRKKTIKAVKKDDSVYITFNFDTVKPIEVSVHLMVIEDIDPVNIITKGFIPVSQ